MHDSPFTALYAGLQNELLTRQQQGLYRQRRVLESAQGVRVQIAGQSYLNFCSNDYLSLASHPSMIEAMQQAAARYGVGSGAAHLVNGHSTPHHRLEEALAEFTGYPRALLFSTGYMANLGVMSALSGRHDTIYADKLNHASLIDAAQLSGARLQRYAHADASALATRLSAHDKGTALIATDGVFSMDGDLAPLPEIAELAAKHQSWLLVDDAHGLGVMGEAGRGSLQHFGLGRNAVPIYMGTLGKALGSFGAFVAGEAVLIETLIQQARSYIYTTALPPAVAEATRTSLKLIQTEADRRQHLHELIRYFRQSAQQLGLPLMESITPIQPLLIGDNQRALAISQGLMEQGLLISAIRPPTVPAGTARLRITLCADHCKADIDQLLDALQAMDLASTTEPQKAPL